MLKISYALTPVGQAILASEEISNTVGHEIGFDYLDCLKAIAAEEIIQDNYMWTERKVLDLLQGLADRGFITLTFEYRK